MLMFPSIVLFNTLLTPFLFLSIPFNSTRRKKNLFYLVMSSLIRTFAPLLDKGGCISA